MKFLFKVFHPKVWNNGGHLLKKSVPNNIEVCLPND